MTMNENDVEKAFRRELDELLKRWGAEIEAEDHWGGYPECGEDVRMTVNIPPVYDADGNMIREWCEIDLGERID